MVSRVLESERSEEHKTADYVSSVQLARKSIEARRFDAAMKHVRRAVSLDPRRPEAWNLLGVLLEIRGDRINAQMNYRTALSLVPAYEPGSRNLHRSTSWKPTGAMALGDKTEEGKGEESKDADHAPNFK